MEQEQKRNFTPYGTDKILDEYVTSEDPFKRLEAIKRSYGFDKLVSDKNEHTRAHVAKQGYGLDKLMNDESFWVRRAVVKQNYCLEKFVDDKEDDIRRMVAVKGYGLDKLIDDPEVRDSVNFYLEKNSLTLNEWKEQNPDKCALKKEVEQKKPSRFSKAHEVERSNELETY